MTSTVLDAQGLLCPLPVLRARKAMKALDVGAELEILATDPGAVPDFKAFCEAGGHTLLATSEADGVFRFLVRKGG